MKTVTFFIIMYVAVLALGFLREAIIKKSMLAVKDSWKRIVLGYTLVYVVWVMSLCVFIYFGINAQ